MTALFVPLMCPLLFVLCLARQISCATSPTVDTAGSNNSTEPLEDEAPFGSPFFNSVPLSAANLNPALGLNPNLNPALGLNANLNPALGLNANLNPALAARSADLNFGGAVSTYPAYNNYLRFRNDVLPTSTTLTDLNLPTTQQSCLGQQPGMYGSPSHACQAFFICQIDGRLDVLPCPQGSRFNNFLRSCDWPQNVDANCNPVYSDPCGRFSALTGFNTNPLLPVSTNVNVPIQCQVPFGTATNRVTPINAPAQVPVVSTAAQIPFVAPRTVLTTNVNTVNPQPQVPFTTTNVQVPFPTSVVNQQPVVRVPFNTNVQVPFNAYAQSSYSGGLLPFIGAGQFRSNSDLLLSNGQFRSNPDLLLPNSGFADSLTLAGTGSLFPAQNLLFAPRRFRTNSATGSSTSTQN